MGAPVGNTNARKQNRMLTDALRRELLQYQEDGVPPGEAASKVAQKLIRMALSGEPWAVRELYDRLDGKPAQALTVDGDGDGGPLRMVTEIAIRAVDP